MRGLILSGGKGNRAGRGARIVHAYLGPFTSIGNEVEVKDTEIEHSIVLERSRVVKERA